MPKKLIVRVRPGVELTCASFPPASALSREDFPTLDRPANAISGTVGAGNFAGSTADVKNFARTFIKTLWKKLKARNRCGPSLFSSYLVPGTRNSVLGTRYSRLGTY